MDRRAVGEAARGAVEGLKVRGGDGVLDAPARRSRNCLPKKAFPGYPSVAIGDVGAIFQSQ